MAQTYINNYEKENLPFLHKTAETLVLFKVGSGVHFRKIQLKSIT
jgi:hypothetical protein